MSTLRAGVGTTVITPPIGVELAGYGIYLNRKSQGIIQNLCSSALVLESAGEKLCIISNDLIGISLKLTSKVRTLIHNHTGIPEHNTLLACTHSHSAPTAVYLRGWGELDKDYLSILPRLIAGSAIIANNSLRPVKVGFRRGEIDGLDYNRCVEGGITDPELLVLAVYDYHNRLLAYIMNYSAHCVSMLHTNTAFSRDHPGIAQEIVSSAHPGALGFFLQGNCGDINVFTVHTSRLLEPAHLLAGETLKVLARIQPHLDRDVPLSSLLSELTLQLQPLTEEELHKLISDADSYDPPRARFEKEWAESMLRKLHTPEAFYLRSQIQALRIGDTAILAHPSELFVQIGVDIKKRSSFEKTIVTGYCNDFIGYVPDRADFERKGYAATVVPKICDNFPFKPDAGESLIRQCLELLSQFAS